eukprot:TRINITY_DN15676_c0_g1_i1.p1 TRINITY_DN15676_c0_g1~~TRINITY_DN15676_c0_g1_i1.p1  ORF type:complete len:179 (-),score=11.34 TRINITY_DN15676_c0_g1_i1:32-499(-)
MAYDAIRYFEIKANGDFVKADAQLKLIAQSLNHLHRFLIQEHQPKCSKCIKVIIGPYIVAEGLKYHESCFICTQCGVRLTKFIEVEGNLYCPEDYSKYLAATRQCQRCNTLLGSRPFQKTEKGDYHNTCFVCSFCGMKLTRYSWKGEKIVCTQCM